MAFQRVAAHFEDIDIEFDSADFNLTGAQLLAKYTSEEGHPVFPREDWQYEARNRDTSLGYGDWLASNLERDFHDLGEETQAAIRALGNGNLITNELGKTLADCADVHDVGAKRLFQMLWERTPQEQRAELLSSSEVAELIGAPGAYQSEHGFGYSGCESDSFESREDAQLNASLAFLKEQAEPAEDLQYSSGPSM
ncbi:hypothetical protein [Geopseudomonas aromaticivorans]